MSVERRNGGPWNLNEKQQGALLHDR
jgi:hypothetical protein